MNRKTIAKVFSIISIVHSVAGIVFVFVFFPVGAALSAAGLVFLWIGKMIGKAGEKEEQID